MYALVCTCDSFDILCVPSDDRSVWIFPTKNDAERYAVDMLMASGVVCRDGDGFFFNGHPERTLDCIEDVLDVFQDSLDMTEYYHVFPVRQNKPLAIERGDKCQAD